MNSVEMNCISMAVNILSRNICYLKTSPISEIKNIVSGSRSSLLSGRWLVCGLVLVRLIVRDIDMILLFSSLVFCLHRFPNFLIHWFEGFYPFSSTCLLSCPIIIFPSIHINLLNCLANQRKTRLCYSICLTGFVSYQRPSSL